MAGLDRHELLKQRECFLPPVEKQLCDWPLRCTGTVCRIPPGRPCFPPKCPGSSAGAPPTDSAEPWGAQQPERSRSRTQWPPSHAVDYHFTEPNLLGNYASKDKSVCHYFYHYSMSPLSLNEASNYLVRFSLTSDSLRMTRVSSRYFIRGATAWSSSSKRTYIEKHIRP